VKHKNYYVESIKLQPGVFRISGVAIHEEIGRKQDDVLAHHLELQLSNTPVPR